jgi:carboxyl-terminal processing protease
MSSRTRLAVAVVSTTLIGYIAVGSLLGRVFGDTSYGQLAIFNEVVRLVLDAYVEPVNLDRAMAGARQGMADALDGDSAYLDADELRAYQQPARDGEGDVGLVLTRRFSFVMVVSPRPGSPAAKAGLRAGDIVRTIDDKYTRQMPAVVAARLLRGAPGSTVKLGIMRVGADPFDVPLTRERLLPAVPEAKVLDGGVGYVRVAEFAPGTGDEVYTKVEALKKGGARRLVLDLRDAGYGAPADAVKVAEVFLKGGPVAKLVGRRQEERVLQADPARSAWSGPLVVLTNNGTAGPGEIVAAALLDRDAARLVGERTFGRVGVERIVMLPEGGLLLTTEKYVSPKGTAIQGEGLKPTVAVDATPDEDSDQDSGAAKPDRILEKALELLRAGGKPA